MIDPLLVIKLSFRLFAVNDKTLRISLGDYIVNDIKLINQKKQNEKLNRAIQALLFGIVSEEIAVTAKKSVEILAELYRKKIWTDARTVNVIGSACMSPLGKVMVAAVHFFLGIETKMQEDDEEEKVSLSLHFALLTSHSLCARVCVRACVGTGGGECFRSELPRTQQENAKEATNSAEARTKECETAQSERKRRRQRKGERRFAAVPRHPTHSRPPTAC
jgi:hypothetical protein